MHNNDDRVASGPKPTPLMDHWRDACLRAFATANPNSTDGRYLASVIGEYFHAMHSALEIIPDPRGQEQFCADEGARFLAMLAMVPERRRQLTKTKADKLRRDGVLVFPDPVGGDVP